MALRTGRPTRVSLSPGTRTLEGSMWALEDPVDPLVLPTDVLREIFEARLWGRRIDLDQYLAAVLRASQQRQGVVEPLEREVVGDERR
jgi:hypothetical protein